MAPYTGTHVKGRTNFKSNGNGRGSGSGNCNRYRNRNRNRCDASLAWIPPEPQSFKLAASPILSLYASRMRFKASAIRNSGFQPRSLIVFSILGTRF